MTDAIVTTDANDRVTAVTPPASVCTAWRRTRAVGHRLDEVVEQLRLDGAPLGTEATASSLDGLLARSRRASTVFGSFAGRPSSSTCR